MRTATRLLGFGVVLLTVSGVAPTKAGEPDQADLRLKVPRLMEQAGVRLRGADAGCRGTRRP